jgi:hypothetical protein
LKLKLSLFLYLAVSHIALANSSIENVDITLKGTLSFSDIIKRTEEQLGIDIKLPTPADVSARKNYNDVITLEMLIKAIMKNYAQENVPVDWKYKNHILEFFRTDRIKRRTSTKKVYKKPSRPKPKKEIPQSRKEFRRNTHNIFEYQKEEDKTYPERPKWTQINKPKANSLEKQNNSIIDMDKSYELTTFEEPKEASFNVVIPTKKKTPPFNKRTYHSNPNITQPSYQKTPTYRSPTVTKTPSVRKSFPNNKIKITPYPENATAYINDAPSISHYTGSEIYIEWETRMKGAIQQKNIKVLNEEKAELEKRLRWLKRQLYMQ